MAMILSRSANLRRGASVRSAHSDRAVTLRVYTV